MAEYAEPPEPPIHLSAEAAYGWECGWRAALRGLEQVGSLIPAEHGGSRFIWKLFHPHTGAQPVYRLTDAGASDVGAES